MVCESKIESGFRSVLTGTTAPPGVLSVAPPSGRRGRGAVEASQTFLWVGSSFKVDALISGLTGLDRGGLLLRIANSGQTQEGS